jgi:hypothetical protein
MITYVLSQAGCFLREALAPGTLAPQVTVNCTCYVVRLDGTVHHVRRDRVCDCGGSPKRPCPALPLVHEYLAAGGARPLGRAPDTWPETWTSVPTQCPVCDCPTTPDPYLNSRAGPGWRCSLAGCEHFWMVRVNPLRRYLATHRLEPRYPWFETPPEERRTWLEAHGHPPRVAPFPSTAGAPLPLRPEPPPRQHALAFPLLCPDLAAQRAEPNPSIHTLR